MNKTIIEQISYGDRKLAHYNAWLLDTKREFGKPYPGFPEDVAAPAAKKTVAKVTDKVTKKGKPSVITARKRSGVTKLDQARELFKSNAKLSRENMIGLFMEQLQMSRAGATTYYYNAQK